MATIELALLSLWNRRGTALLTIASIAISVALLLSVQTLRTAARDGFAATLSGTDLIVGARSSPVNLLLYSVFRIGDATANVSWASYRKIADHPDVAWTIPISLGDTHRGFRVMGTDDDYFRHYHFADNRGLRFAAGRPFDQLYDAVLGADVARTLHYALGTSIVLAHGLGEVSFAEHKDRPFRVVGILEKTGTPVDRTVHVSLQAITAIHLEWRGGGRAPGDTRAAAAQIGAQDLTPDNITAFLVGMRSRVMAFTMQRAIDDYRQETLSAIMPGVALTRLWDLVGIADAALMVVAAFVVLAGLMGMATAILTSLNERRREMAILRSIGATPWHVFLLLQCEAGALATLGVGAGVALSQLSLAAGRPILQHRFGIYFPLRLWSPHSAGLLCIVVASALFIGLLPALRAYRNTLSDGLQIRV